MDAKNNYIKDFHDIHSYFSKVHSYFFKVHSYFSKVHSYFFKVNSQENALKDLKT